MLCKQCKEQIDVGEAEKPEPIPGETNKYWHFHTGCHIEWRSKRDGQEVPLEVVVQLAWLVH